MIRTFSRPSAWLALLLPAAAWAQVSGPVLGLTPDGSQIRRIYGLPGAGVVGEAIDTGGDLGRVAISPRQDYVLGTQAATGIPLVIVPGRAARAISGASANPDRIILSPRGSSAALWFDTARRFQIASGLPGSPSLENSVRSVDGSFLGAPAAIAVSDDGRWLAASSPNGVYLFGPDGAAAPLQVDGVLALAFFSQRSDLALATATQVLAITDLDGARVTTVLHRSAIQPPRAQVRSLSRPVAIAASFDNRKLVVAGRTGTLLSLDLPSHTSSTFDCRCSPEGLFGMRGSVFRLTSPRRDGLKLFDASAGAVDVVPEARPVAEVTAKSSAPTATAPVPQVTIGGIPSTTGFKQQPAMTISIAAPYPADITGTVTLNFASSVGGNDQMIRFVNGDGSFTIPAGATRADFSGKSSLGISTGTVAGTITLTVDLQSGGADITPTPAPTATYTTNPSVPFIQTVTLNRTSSGVTVLLQGFSSSREMVSGLFHFAPAENSTIAQTDVTVPLDSAFAAWYQNGASNAFGSEFLLTMPFPVKGNPADIIAVTVTLTNSKGTSNPASE